MSTSAASNVRMNSRPMILRFGLGVGDAGQRLEELLLRVDDDQPGAGRRHEVALDLLGLALPHQPVVDVDAGEPVADRLLHDRGRHGRVDAAGEAADRAAVRADLLADPLDLLVGDVADGPGLAAARDVPEEVLEDPLPVLGVQHLGVPLHTGEPAVDVLERRHRRTRRRREHGEVVRRRGHRVAVGHPHVVLGRDAAEQGAGMAHVDPGAAVLPRAGLGDRAAQPLRHQLEAVTHAEDRRTGLEDGRVEARRALRVDRRRPAGQDDRLRPLRHHLGHRHGVRHDLGVDPRLAHPTRDQLGVLRPEVDHQDQIVLRRRHDRILSSRKPENAPGPDRGGRVVGP